MEGTTGVLWCNGYLKVEDVQLLDTGKKKSIFDCGYRIQVADSSETSPIQATYRNALSTQTTLRRHVEFYMSPQCGQNVLHVACIGVLYCFIWGILDWDSARKGLSGHPPVLPKRSLKLYYNFSESCFQHTRHSTGQFNDRRATDSMRCHALLLASWPARMGCWAARPGGAATKHRLLTHSLSLQKREILGNIVSRNFILFFLFKNASFERNCAAVDW